MNKPWKNNKQLKRLCINMLIFYQTVIHTCCIKLVISCSLNPQSHVALPARDKTTFHRAIVKRTHTDSNIGFILFSNTIH
jgi:hypothetical protein